MHFLSWLFASERAFPPVASRENLLELGMVASRENLAEKMRSSF